MSANVEMNDRPAPDQVLVDIAKYVCSMEIKSTEAYDTARNCLIDTLGCGLEALEYPGKRFVLAVQWHPEAGQDTRLFDAFIRTCATATLH